MSTPDNSHFGQILPIVPYPPTFSSNKTPFVFGDGSASALNFVPVTNYVLAPHGEPIWQGSADDLAALVRDAKRFRKLERLTFGCDHMIGMSRRKNDHVLVWGEGKTLAEIADALPEEQP